MNKIIEEIYNATIPERAEALKKLLIMFDIAHSHEIYPGYSEQYIDLSEIQKLYGANIYVKLTNNPEA